MTDVIETDVLIVGGGPIGMEVAWRLKGVGVACQQVEAGELGATFGWWAPNTRFFSSPERIAICGVPLVTADQGKCTGEQYRDYLRAVAVQHDLRVRTFERVVSIARLDEGGFEAHTERSEHGVGGVDEIIRTMAAGNAPVYRRYRARRVVLAIGNMHRPRELGVSGESLPHVSHYFEGPHRHFGRRVLIVGGKNSAVEAALRCWRAGAEVTMSYRGSKLDEKRVKYWLRPEIEWLIERGEIAWMPHTRVVRIKPDAAHLASAGDGASKEEEREVPADDVLLLTGYVQDSTLFDQLGLELVTETRRPRLDSETQESSVPGVYVAGTACAGSMTRATVFIENAHVHAERIAAAIAGGGTPEEAPAAPEYGVLEES